jgi:hypothetical protein
MKTCDTNNLSPLAQTINECLLRQTEPSLAHSKGKPDVSSTSTNINVRFAAPCMAEIQIRVAASEARAKPAYPVPLTVLAISL